MRAYVLVSGARLAPFGDLVRDLPVGNVPLFARQRALLERFGLEVVEVDALDAIPSDAPALVTRDDVYFTRRVLKSFLARWRARPTDAVRLALPTASTFVERYATLQALDVDGPHTLYPLWGLAPGAGPVGARLAAAAPLPVVYAERRVEVPVPPHITGRDRWTHPITSSVCLPIRHWVHLLQANLLSIQVEWLDTIITRPWVGMGILLKSLLRRGGLAARIGGAANLIGRGVSIHPSAIVEGSILGDGVRIGPQALVRGAVIGAGAVLEQRVDVSYAVLGPRCFVSKHSLVWATVALEEAELCMKGMQMCLVGRGAALTARATPLDVTPGRRLRVRDGDAIREIDLDVLGACFGHRCFVGADVFTGPGREVPNGVRIVPDPSRVLARVPDVLEPDALYAVRDGTLVRVG
jgi:acetyltransferase-like isoleucine patch superfamily enzyme